MSARRIEEMLSESGLDPARAARRRRRCWRRSPSSTRLPPPRPSWPPVRVDAGRTVRAARCWVGVARWPVSGPRPVRREATGLSAAANTLPRPLQHGVSQFSQHYLPFDLPEPPPPPKEPPSLGAPMPPGPLPVGERTDDPASRSTPGRPLTRWPRTPTQAGHPRAAQPTRARVPRPATARRGSPARRRRNSRRPRARPPVAAQDWHQGPVDRPTPTPTSQPTDRAAVTRTRVAESTGDEKGKAGDKNKNKGKGGPGKDDGSTAPTRAASRAAGADRPRAGSDPGGHDCRTAAAGAPGAHDPRARPAARAVPPRR